MFISNHSAPASYQPVIKPVEFPKYTRNAAGEIVPVETSVKPVKPARIVDEDGFTAGLDEGMKDLPEVKGNGPEGIEFAAEGGKITGEEEYLSDVNITNKGIAKKTITKLKFKPSSGVNLEATPGKTTTILGNYKKDMQYIIDELGNVKSTDFGSNNGSFNVLNIPDDLYKSPEQFWEEYNKPWLDDVIKRGDDIVFATEPGRKSFYRYNKATRKIEITGYGREYRYLYEHGYRYDSMTHRMVLK